MSHHIFFSRLTPRAEPKVGLELTTLKSATELRSKVGPLTDSATQETLITVLLSQNYRAVSKSLCSGADFLGLKCGSPNFYIGYLGQVI